MYFDTNFPCNVVYGKYSLFLTSQLFFREVFKTNFYTIDMRKYNWKLQWKPRLCKTLKEINAAFTEFGIFGKKIKALQIIGMAGNLNPDSYEQYICRKLFDAGWPYKRYEKYPYKDKVPFPLEAEVSEPSVFIFEDESSLEIMPLKSSSGGLLVSSNQIPHRIKDGINHSNFNSKRMFKLLQGTSIREADIRTSTEHEKTERWGNEHKTTEREYILELDIPYKVSEKYNFRSYSSYIAIKGSVGQYSIGIDDYFVPFSVIKKSLTPIYQIPIIDGTYGSGFWIYPAKYSNKDKTERKPLFNEDTSIDELYIGEFLMYFLLKYYDKTIPYHNVNKLEQDDTQFQFYLYDNLYTYSAMREMIAEIRQCADLLENDYFNKILDPVKKNITPYFLNYRDGRTYPEIPKEEYDEIVRKNIWPAIDFYRRFADRMETVMEHCPQCDLISFEGP